MSQPSSPLSRARAAAGRDVPPTARGQVLAMAVDYAAQAPSVAAQAPSVAPSTPQRRPWRIDLHPDRLVIRAEPSRRLPVDPKGRGVLESVGAALFNVRVALARGGWSADVERLARPNDPDVLAEVRPVPGAPDSALAQLAPAVYRRRTNRRRFTCAHVPDDVIRRLTEIAETDGVLLIPIVDEAQLLLIGRLIRRADGLLNADPASRAERRCWTTRAPGDRAGEPPARTDSDADQMMVLLATRTDDELAWLRAGEAMQHVWLELTRLDWVAVPVPQPIEVPLTRTQLRAAFTWNAHPQLLFQVGPATPTSQTPGRPGSDVAPDGEAFVPPPARRPASNDSGRTTGS